MTGRRTPLLTARLSALMGLSGILLLVVLVGIAWRTTSALWFLIFPLLLIGILLAGGAAVLWILRHF